jgi:Domain of unknown function (DUF4340)
VSRTQQGLLALLVLQLALLLIFQNPFAHGGVGAQALLPKLASITPERIEIAGADSASVTLERRSGAWVLSKPDGYPVAPGKVEKLIQDLEKLTTERPVASDPSSHAALKVAADQYERRVRLWTGASGAPAAELFMGTSPGVGATHVRAGGSDRVFEINGLSAYDVPADAASWIERQMVTLQAEDVARVELQNQKGRFVLEHDGGAWRVVAPASSAGASLDADKVLGLVRALCSLSIEKPVGPLDERAQGLANPEAAVRLVRQAAASDSAAATAAPEEVSVQIGATLPGKDSRYGTRTGLPFAVSIAKYSYDRALTAELKDLVKS